MGLSARVSPQTSFIAADFSSLLALGILFYRTTVVAAWDIPIPALSTSCCRRPIAPHNHLALRLPRVSAAFVCGGLLALAGALSRFCCVIRLADPYIWAVSGGAAVVRCLRCCWDGRVLTNLARWLAH